MGVLLHTHLDGQFGDAGLDGSSSVPDAHVHAVISGVVQAERPLFHRDVGCVVFTRREHTPVITNSDLRDRFRTREQEKSFCIQTDGSFVIICRFGASRIIDNGRGLKNMQPWQPA